MTKVVVTGHDDLIGPWVMDKLSATWLPGESVSIGLMDIAEDGKGEILAGVLYEDFNQANVMCHIAAVPGRNWLNRHFLWYIFYYPFVQLKCHRITVVVADTNADCRNFVTSLGFELEATLKDAHPKGDLLVYKILADNCKWWKLNLKGIPPCNSLPFSTDSSGTTA